MKVIEHRPDERVRREARLSGLGPSGAPSLDLVRRRRWEVWALAAVVVLASAAALVLIAVSPPQLGPRPRFLGGGLLLLVVAFGSYAVEKEVHLKRLTRLILDRDVMNADLANYVRELSAVVAAGQAVARIRDLDGTLDAVLAAALQLVGGSAGSVMFRDGTGLQVARSTGPTTGPDDRGAVDDEVVHRVATTGRPVMTAVPVASSDSRETEGFAGGHVRLLTPLVIDGTVLGILIVTAGPERQPSDYDLQMLSAFAEHASPWIANAKLYEAQRAWAGLRLGDDLQD